MLTYEQSEQLKAAGFTDWEIGQFSEGRTPDGTSQPQIDLNGDTWKNAMETRRSWTEQLIKKGWTQQEITKNIYDQYNRDPKSSPWDFLKTEYKPPQKAPYKSTLNATKKVSAFKSEVGRTFRTEERKRTKKFYEETRGEQITRLQQIERERQPGESISDVIRRLREQGR